MPRRGFGSAPCATKHAALCISKKKPHKTHQNNPSPSPICMFAHLWGPKWAFWGALDLFFYLPELLPAWKAVETCCNAGKAAAGGEERSQERGGIFLACLCACSPASLRELQSHQHIPAPSGAGTDPPGASPQQGLGFWEPQWGPPADPITASALRDIRRSTAAWG